MQKSRDIFNSFYHRDELEKLSFLAQWWPVPTEWSISIEDGLFCSVGTAGFDQHLGFGEAVEVSPLSNSSRSDPLKLSL
jgi:hypothetical protein